MHMKTFLQSLIKHQWRKQTLVHPHHDLIICISKLCFMLIKDPYPYEVLLHFGSTKCTIGNANLLTAHQVHFLRKQLQ